MPGASKVPIYPGAEGMVVARLTIPFISINAKNETLKSKACITNQYLPVSSNQMMTDVKKTINTLKGERREASPSRNLFMRLMMRSCNLVGVKWVMNHKPNLAMMLGNMAATIKTNSAPRNIP